MTGLPSLHALDRTHGARIWMASEAVDMRCGFDRLAEQVRAVIGQDPLGGHLFVFRSRRGDRLKILMWDQDGFLLWYNQPSSHYISFRSKSAFWGPACKAAARSIRRSHRLLCFASVFGPGGS